MLCFLGIKVLQTVTNSQKYKQALQEINHYLSLKRDLQVHDNGYVLFVARGQYSLQLPSNSYYLLTCHYNIPVLHQEDLQFLDICYECAMILREAFPSKIVIELVTDSEDKLLDGFQERKKEEFNRRVNASLKALIQSKVQLSHDEIEDIIFMCANHYSRKNKVSALRHLISRVNSNNLAYPAQYIEALQRLQQDNDLRKLVVELITKIKALARQHELNKENHMNSSNLSHSPEPSTLKINPLIFQLKESFSIQRICLLLASTLQKDQSASFLAKIESSIVVVTNRFLADEYQDQKAFGIQLAQLVKVYWQRRGKDWQKGQREAVERKVKQLNSQSRVYLNRSKLQTSRKIVI